MNTYGCFVMSVEEFRDILKKEWGDDITVSCDGDGVTVEHPNTIWLDGKGEVMPKTVHGDMVRSVLAERLGKPVVSYHMDKCDRPAMYVLYA